MPLNERTPAPGKGVGSSEVAPRTSEQARDYRRGCEAATRSGTRQGWAFRTIFNDDGHFQGLEVVL